MQDIENDTLNQTEEGFPKEALLELVMSEEGDLQLRDMNDKDDPLVSIEFSEKVKEMLGVDTHLIGQHMIHSAIQLIMSKQISQWQARIYDEEPEHYS